MLGAQKTLKEWDQWCGNCKKLVATRKENGELILGDGKAAAVPRQAAAIPQAAANTGQKTDPVSRREQNKAWRAQYAPKEKIISTSTVTAV
jgi:hypothetical protein